MVMRISWQMCFISTVFLVIFCNSTMSIAEPIQIASPDKQLATVGGGCFWCIEAVFQRLIGVENVASGYAGGSVKDPSYEQVSAGNTAHAEVVQITFDPKQISYAELLKVFFHLHDPTTLNRQGADVGTQYRSIILYHSEEQKNVAERVKAETDKSGLWPQPIVTEIKSYDAFYVAEEEHQDFYNRNKTNRYCSIVIAPKVAKLMKEFAGRVR